MIKNVAICDVCGKQIQNGGFRYIMRFIFHIEFTGCEVICTECFEQLKAMREANIMAERKEEK